MNEINNSNSLSLIGTDDDRNQDRFMTNTFILARTDVEKSHFRAIQPALNKINIRVRAMDQSNILYICHDNYWQQQAQKYMTNIGVYSLIGDMNSLDKHCESILKQTTDQIVSTLHHLFIRRAITIQQYEQMMYFNQLSTFRVNELYFIPKLYEMENIVMQPMLTSHAQEPIKAMARFLNILLQPLYDKATELSICTSGIDAIQAFEIYTKQNRLRSSTLLVNVQILDLSTLFSHDLMIEALTNFFQTYADNKLIQGTSKTTIIQLVQLILQYQYFLYENKLYQQLAGGPLSLPLTKTLVNIYLWYCQLDLVSMLSNKEELFGRCENELFFTWHESKEELQTLLDEKIIRHDKTTNIHLRTSMGHKIHYLDAEFGHHEGILQTNVYHRVNIEPYALPYVYDTTKRQEHSYLLRDALVRAVLYCSNVDEFENERFYIELSFMINNASLDFIQETIEKFYREFNVPNIEPYFDQDMYDILRQYVRLYQERRTKYHRRQRNARQRRRQRNLLLTN